MIIEIKRPPNRNGNSKRLYVQIDQSCIYTVTTEQPPNGIFPAPCVSLEVTEHEYQQWDALRRAQADLRAKLNQPRKSLCSDETAAELANMTEED